MKKFTDLTVIVFFIALNLLIFQAWRSYAAEPAAPPSPKEIQKELQKEIREEMAPEPKKKVETPAQKFERIKKKLPPIKMVLVKGGCFKMGDATGEGDEDERPAHQVCISDYYMAETVVTRGLYATVMDIPEPKYPDYPVTNVSYIDVLSFINILNAITKGFYRLPTEAEWEYAARSRGKNEIWPGVNNEAELGDYAWFADNANNDIHPVKQKKPNGLGLYDMAGNVWEWTEDNFDFDFYKKGQKQDPYNASFSQWRTIRGGSAFDNAYKLRTTYRYALEPANELKNTGFRLAE